jgi:transposase-like protein
MEFRLLLCLPQLLISRLGSVFAATSREQALGLASAVAKKWRGKGIEKVAEHMEEHVEECLSCLTLPESHRKRIRTTNGLEWASPARADTLTLCDAHLF